MLTFRFSGADGSMVVPETLTSGMVGKEVALEFSSDWDGLSKTAVFTAGNVIRDVAGVTDTAVIPAEVLATPLEQLYVGVYGVSDDGKVTPTVRAAGPQILPGVDPSGDAGTDPDLPVWAQLQVQIDDLNEAKSSYYRPDVSQPADNILRFDWVASDPQMPDIPPAAFVLPSGSDTVRYTVQELDDAQKAQARANIGAAEAAFVTRTTRYTIEGGGGDVIAGNVGRVNTSGVFEATNSFRATDFAAVSPGAAITYSVIGYTGIASVAFYDGAKTFLSCIAGEANSTRIEGTVTVPAGAAYVRFTMLAGTADQYAAVTNTREIQLSCIGDMDLLETSDKSNIVAAINEAAKSGVSDTVETVTRYTTDAGGGDVIATGIGYIDTAGERQATASFDCTDYIEIDEKSVIDVKFEYRTTLASAAFYDAEKVFISCVKADGTDRIWTEESLAIPAGAAYVRFSFNAAYGSEYAVVTNTAVVTVDVVSLDRTLREHDTASVEMDYTTLLSEAFKAAYINTGGGLDATNSWVASRLYQIDGSCRIDFSLYATASTCPIAFYDRNGDFLSGLTGTASGIQSGSGIVPPDGAYYLRCCAIKSSAYAGQFLKITYKRMDMLETTLERLQTENPLLGKIMTATGDSITATVSNRPYASYARMIAAANRMTYETAAIWGATIADGVSGSSGCILTTLDAMRQDADYVILSGGANDFYHLSSGAEALGEISAGYTADLDTTTFCGALESMCKTAVSRWPGKKILYVITHRMLDISHGDLDSWVARMIAILEKWGIPYVDLWHGMPSLMLPALKNLYTTNGNTVYVGTGDGLHPNEDGYQLYYVPPVEAKLKSI